jgi:hypothetical protein
MRARSALGGAFAALGGRPAATLAGLFAGAAGALIAASSSRVAEARFVDGALRQALVVVGGGAIIAGLVAGSGLSLAVAAATGDRPPLAAALGGGLRLLFVRMVEWLLLATLFLAAAAPAIRFALAGGGAAGVALALFGPLLLALLTFGLFRVARAGIAAGRSSATAIADGARIVLTRLPSLARLALLLVLATTPFSLAAIAISRAAPETGLRHLLAIAAEGALAAATALWSYTSLAILAKDGKPEPATP